MSAKTRVFAVVGFVLAATLMSVLMLSARPTGVTRTASPAVRPVPVDDASVEMASPAARPAARLRTPPDAEIARRLRAAGHIGPDAEPEAVDRAVDAWLTDFGASSRTWADPEAERRIAANERVALSESTQAATPITAAVLVIPVEFAAAETLAYQVHSADGSECVTVTHAFTEPLHGAIPYPGVDITQTIDNQTVYYPSTEPADYEQLIFGREGYTAPIRAGDPNVNGGAGADISGLTVQTYFDAQSDGTVNVTGEVAPWVSVPHAEAYYGIDVCLPGLSSRAIPDEQLGSLADLTVGSAEALKARGGTYATYDFWRQFDDDGDGVLDALWIIHAGRGQEYGGGAQGEQAIWSRASDVRNYENADGSPTYPGGHVIHDNGTPETGDDLRLGKFTMLPEDSDLGVLVEEFGHSFFGVPDLYTMNSSNSIGWWAPMSSGIWGGELGGTRPVNMPLWFRMVADCAGQPCGWADPVKVVTYTTSGEVVVLGQAGEPAGGTVTEGPYAGQMIHEGLRVELPDQVETVPNKTGEGGGAYSGSVTGRHLTLDRAVDLTGATAPISLTFDGYWEIKRLWGYAYVEVSTDGETFTGMPDEDGVFNADDPMGFKQGVGTTGDGEGRMVFDLSAYAGESITLRFRHFTYQGAPGTGWWIDNVAISGGALEEDFEDGIGAWTSAGWVAVPLTERHPHHYLVEWRNDNGYDASLKGAYNTSYGDQDEWRVDRVPANVPGAVVMYRNLKYPFTGAFVGNLDDAPSWGSKYGLLVVDTNFWPTERPSGHPFPGRLESLDAPLALQDQPGYTLERRHPVTGALTETEQMPGRPGHTRVDDAHGYYPGFYVDDEGDIPAWDEDASVVVPSRDGRRYSTRLTNKDGDPMLPAYGAPFGNGHTYGTGDPGDDNAHYGVHIELIDQAEDGSWGAVRVYNAAVDYALTASADVAVPGQTVTYTLSADNLGAVPVTVTYRVTLPTGAAGATAELLPGGSITRTYPVYMGDILDWDWLDKVYWTAATFDDGTDVWVRIAPLLPPEMIYLPAAGIGWAIP